ncbi:MAG: M48 family metallopeptidase [Firmicutes bacterium]|nr:M48 family metallopeptidase [Bacillota bacterium]MCM1401432.1 M48 family metallopeptidase [Bacteroides sp.]MCM1476790.1 M48 family metallopeptidase [Bacteroides sp.]
MKKILISIALCLALGATSVPASAQFSWTRALSGLVKAGQAMTLTDAQMAEYVKASVAQMDKENTVLPASSPYTQRLKRLTAGITNAGGIPLNFKVYQTKEVNAFACPDGSVRVFTGLMDVMTDDELLGVIGHEIGHVLKHHSKNALKNQLYTGALHDAIASTGGRAAALTDSQLGAIGETLISAKYSRSQESEADDCGYDFLVSKGKNPWGMVAAFEKLSQMEQQGSGINYYVGKMFSSHPDSKARIARMTERCKKDGYVRTSSSTKSTTKKAATKSKRK